MKNPQASKKGPGRRPLTKIDIGTFMTSSMPDEFGKFARVFAQRKVKGSWLPGAKLRKQILAKTVGVRFS